MTVATIHIPVNVSLPEIASLSDELAQTRVSLLTRLDAIQNDIRVKIKEVRDTMATQEQVDLLASTLQGKTAQISDAVDGIRQDIADLRAAHPDIDLSSLEGNVSALGTVADEVSALDAENPAAGPTE